MRSWKLLLPPLAAAAFCLALPLETARAAPSPDGSLASLQFLSGGVGYEGRRMKPAGYQAKFVFVNTKGEYFADVKVTFRREGKNRTVRSDGPWLWVKGEPGRYRVEARSGRAAARRPVTLPPKGTRTIVFRLK